MSVACPHTHLWLRCTLYTCLQTTTSCCSRHVRAASTTSAIKRGLRAEQTREEEGSGRDRTKKRDPHDRNVGKPWKGLVRNHVARVPLRHIQGGDGVKKILQEHVPLASEREVPFNAEDDPLGGVENPFDVVASETARPLKIRSLQTGRRATGGLSRASGEKGGDLAERGGDAPVEDNVEDRANSDIKDSSTAALKVHRLITLIQGLESNVRTKEETQKLFLKRQELRSLLAFVTARMHSEQWQTTTTRRALISVLGNFAQKGKLGRPLWTATRPRDAVSEGQSVIAWSQKRGENKAFMNLLVASGEKSEKEVGLEERGDIGDVEIMQNAWEAVTESPERRAERLRENAGHVQHYMQTIHTIERRRDLRGYSATEKEWNTTRADAVSALHRLLPLMNSAPAPALREAMLTDCHPAGELWKHKNGRPRGMDKSVVWLNINTGKLELVLRSEGRNNSGQQLETEMEENVDDPFIDSLQARIGNIRKLIVRIQKGEMASSEFGRQEKSLRRAPEADHIERLLAILASLNHSLRTGEHSVRDVRRSLEAKLGKAGQYWVREQPSGDQSIIWWKEDGRFELVLKGSLSLSSSDKAHEASLKSKMEGLAARSGARKQGAADSQYPQAKEPGKRAMDEDSTGQDDRDLPLALPYTVAASSFLYGSNTVLAALSAKRRKLYHLYLHPRSLSSEKNAETIEKLARDAEIPISKHTNLALMDKMSGRRPHNGVVLEASSIPAPPVLGLSKPDQRLNIIPLTLDRQSVEGIAVNGAPDALPSLTNTWRHPFVLLLDGITDEGNLGNIIRTAHFYGVDAIAIAKNTCASINSSVVAKASSGAVEAMQILSLPGPSKFVFNCAKERWRVYAAMPPPVDSFSSSGKSSSMSKSNDANKHVTATSVASGSPLAKQPCILMLGAEGDGLRDNLINRADYFVSIAQGERGVSIPGVGVDSVNVGVAAGVLVESFMRRPKGAMNLVVESDLGF